MNDADIAFEAVRAANIEASAAQKRALEAEAIWKRALVADALRRAPELVELAQRLNATRSSMEAAAAGMVLPDGWMERMCDATT